eukprot:13378051-Ditylum_brightwellii.AAC.1
MNHNLLKGETIASGQASLTGLVEQRQRLQGNKRALLDIGNMSDKSCIYVIYTIFWICCGTYSLFLELDMMDPNPAAFKDGTN